eukprot:scaffold135221_cov112-Phaeocystis_antarctica.AAC.1
MTTTALSSASCRQNRSSSFGYVSWKHDSRFSRRLAFVPAMGLMIEMPGLSSGHLSIDIMSTKMTLPSGHSLDNAAVGAGVGGIALCCWARCGDRKRQSETKEIKCTATATARTGVSRTGWQSTYANATIAITC